MAPQRYVYNVHDVISCLNFILLLLSTLLVYRGIRISIISLIANIIKNLIFQTFPERQNQTYYSLTVFVKYLFCNLFNIHAFSEGFLLLLNTIHPFPLW